MGFRTYLIMPGWRSTLILLNPNHEITPSDLPSPADGFLLEELAECAVRSTWLGAPSLRATPGKSRTSTPGSGPFRHGRSLAAGSQGPGRKRQPRTDSPATQRPLDGSAPPFSREPPDRFPASPGSSPRRLPLALTLGVPSAAICLENAVIRARLRAAA